MSSKDYIPRYERELLDWAKELFGYSAANCAMWKVAPPSEESLNLLAAYEAALAITELPNRGKVDVSRKNGAKKALVKACRSYVQGFLAKNPYVSDVERKRMRLTIYDKEPTPVTDPVGLAVANIKYPNKGALELHIQHDDSTPANAKANYGYRIYYGVYSSSDTPPESGEDLRESLFTRQKKQLFIFKPKDSGKTAFFSIRYENSKGKAGQWGKLFSAIIP